MFQKSTFILIFCLGIFLNSCKKEEPATIPVLSTSPVNNITAITAVSGGSITSDGDSKITASGVCWSTGVDPTTSDTKTTENVKAGQFVSNLTGLSAGTTYHIRAYATNSVGTAYGADLSFSTLGQAPSGVTLAASSVSTTGVTLNGTVNPNDLSSTVTFEYGTTTNYGLSVNAVQSPVTGSNNVNVSADVSGLTIGTTYHFRLKVVNALGTTFGSDMTFTTSGQAPTSQTLDATNVTGTTVMLNGIVNANNLSTSVTFEFGTTTAYGNTVTASQSPIAGNTGVNVSANITGLALGTSYHFRVRATNSLGTVYGEDVTFSTVASTLPRVSTEYAYWIGFGLAQSGGNVISEGDSPVTSRGVCWSTNQNPTINDNKTIDGSGIGSFGSVLTDLMPYPQFFIRAYATNSAGTAYGEEMYLFCEPPGVGNLFASNITGEGALLNAEVFGWSADIPMGTFRVWNQDGYNQFISYPGGPGQISVEVSGLNLGTTYYFSVEVISMCGTITVSETIEFVTLNTGTVSDVDGNNYKTVKIGGQIWMAENLRTTKYSDGSGIPLVNNSGTWNALIPDAKAYCWYGDDIANKSTYGALYTWAAAMNGSVSSSLTPSGVQGVCPTGWHLPSDNEWTELVTYLGDNAGGKLKETGTIHWQSPNAEATNESGFTGLPGGQRFVDGAFVNFKSTGTWWCSTEWSSSYGWYRGLSSVNGLVDRSSYYKSLGQSVRCLKD